MLLCVIVKWFVPGVLCALALIKSTTVSQLMAIADRMKIPYKCVIPLAVVLRFFPTLSEEWENIRRAMKMRGIGISLEHVMVPIISASVRIGEELSAAALSRGLGYAQKRTNMCQVRLQVTDYILMLLFIGNGVITYGKIL
jgi:energy-coupling factor transport system permease protein